MLYFYLNMSSYKNLYIIFRKYENGQILLAPLLSFTVAMTTAPKVPFY